MGVITKSIEDQTYDTLDRAIKAQLKEQGKKLKFHDLSIIKNIVENNLRRDIIYFVREPIHPEEIIPFFEKSSHFYEELEKFAEEKDESFWEDINYKLAGVSKRFKREASKIYPRQERMAFKQVFRLMKKKVDDTDRKILAEASYLKEFYEKQVDADTHVFICSFDQHFIPVRKRIVSSIITDKIKERFGIKCDRPDELIKMVKNKNKKLK